MAAQAGWPGLRVRRSGPAWAFGPARELPVSRARTRNPADRVDAGEAGDERWPRPTGSLMKFTPQGSARPDRRCRRGAAGAGAPGSGQHHERPVHRHALGTVLRSPRQLRPEGDQLRHDRVLPVRPVDRDPGPALGRRHLGPCSQRRRPARHHHLPTPSPSPAPARCTSPPPRPSPIPMPGGTTTRRCTTRCASGSPATASRPRGRSGRTARWSRSTCDPQAPAGTGDQERRGRRARASPPSGRAAGAQISIGRLSAPRPQPRIATERVSRSAVRVTRSPIRARLPSCLPGGWQHA